MQEFDDSTPVDALPSTLPKGERLIWQGRPTFSTFAVRALHIRKVAIYFAILMAWRFVADLVDGLAVIDGLISALWVLPLATATLVFLAGFAWLVRRSTVYTLTSRQLILRHGAALPKTVTIPLSLVESADLKLHPDGTGDIAIATAADRRLSFVMLWPHARPWHFGRPQASLRAIPDAENVASRLADALQGVAVSTQPRTGNAGQADVRDGAGTLAAAAG